MHCMHMWFKSHAMFICHIFDSTTSKVSGPVTENSQLSQCHSYYWNFWVTKWMHAHVGHKKHSGHFGSVNMQLWAYYTKSHRYISRQEYHSSAGSVNKTRALDKLLCKEKITIHTVKALHHMLRLLLIRELHYIQRHVNAQTRKSL